MRSAERCGHTASGNPHWYCTRAKGHSGPCAAWETELLDAAAQDRRDEDYEQWRSEQARRARKLSRETTMGAWGCLFLMLAFIALACVEIVGTVHVWSWLRR